MNEYYTMNDYYNSDSPEHELHTALSAAKDNGEMVKCILNGEQYSVYRVEERMSRIYVILIIYSAHAE